MAKAFSVMKTNVGNQVMDTSTAMATLIGVWLNDKYKDVSRRCEWAVLIDDDYTIAVTAAGGATYALPADFDHEIFVADKTNGIVLKRYNTGNWWTERSQDYSGAALQTGQPTKYIIELQSGKVRLDPAPNATLTLAFPYKTIITDLSADADEPVILDIEFLMEMGAIGEAWAYKKQFNKADYYFQRYETEVNKRVGQERSQINQMYQWISAGYRVHGVSRLTGDNSYDSL